MPMTAAQKRAYYQRKREAGICLECTEIVETGKARCSEHLALNSRRPAKKQRAKVLKSHPGGIK